MYFSSVKSLIIKLPVPVIKKNFLDWVGYRIVSRAGVGAAASKMWKPGAEAVKTGTASQHFMLGLVNQIHINALPTFVFFENIIIGIVKKKFNFIFEESKVYGNPRKGRVHR